MKKQEYLCVLLLLLFAVMKDIPIGAYFLGILSYFLRLNTIFVLVRFSLLFTKFV